MLPHVLDSPNSFARKDDQILVISPFTFTVAQELHGHNRSFIFLIYLYAKLNSTNVFFPVCSQCFVSHHQTSHIKGIHLLMLSLTPLLGQWLLKHGDIQSFVMSLREVTLLNGWSQHHRPGTGFTLSCGRSNKASVFSRKASILAEWCKQRAKRLGFFPPPFF